MIENRELNMDDYLAMLRRRAKVILLTRGVGPARWLSGVFSAFPPGTPRSRQCWWKYKRFRKVT